MAKRKATGSKAKTRGGKSKAESMTGKKEAAAEMRTASSAQAEMDMPKPDDILFHMRSIKGLKEKATTINGAVRNARKSAAKLNKFLPAVIDELLALERATDPTEFQNRMEILGIGLKAIGHHVQLTLHDTLLGDETELAYGRGFDAGRNGQTLVNPYPPHSDLSESYSTGWRNGMAQNVPGYNGADEAAATSSEPAQPEPPPRSAELQAAE